MKKNKLKDYLHLYLVFLIYSLVSVFAKIAAGQSSAVMTLVFMGLEFLFLGVYALFWQQILKKFPLVVAMSNKGITLLYALAWSAFLLKERITVWNIVGVVIIIFGIWLVSSDG